MGLVLEGMLNAPYPDDPAEMGIVEWAQARNAMREAWVEIERLREENRLLHEGITGVYLKGHMDGVEKARSDTGED